ncbi:hypothetical protein [Vibrio atlanticus]|uniref:Uncharacterized protein n=1 Tax=Vibrio atlanticus TaxID=693153 RepID=A0A1C3ILE6_9VIBR|nr:hypothetical protein [Vibrio atlanticus]SBS62219.1 hypothetical protein VAT7223_01039 [Vibrio atlanticus]
MCNAHNHLPSCNCGYGRGRNSSFSSRGYQPSSIESKPEKDKAEVFSPLLILMECNQCGKSVYFYRSRYNGRVFFDSLGKPWPKHLCLSNDSVKTTDDNFFDILSMQEQKNLYTKITGIHKDEVICLTLQTEVLNKYKININSELKLVKNKYSDKVIYMDHLKRKVEIRCQ